MSIDIKKMLRSALVIKKQSIDDIVLNTGVDGLYVIKFVEKRKISDDENEFRITVKVAKKMESVKQFLEKKGYGSIQFYGDSYDSANACYLAWFYDITKNDDKRDKPLMVRHILDNLKLKKD